MPSIIFNTDSIAENHIKLKLDTVTVDVTPIDRYTVPPEELITLTGETLQEQLYKYGYKNPEQLLGNCNTNSVALLSKLSANGYNPELCVGVISDLGNESGLIDAFQNIKNVHQWVEVDGYIAEICTESTPNTGTVYISEKRPSNYSVYKRLSYSEFKELNVESINATNIEEICEKIF